MPAALRPSGSSRQVTIRPARDWPTRPARARICRCLEILARAGLVGQERAGRIVTCRLLPEGLSAAGIWLQGVGGFDPEDYDALEELLRGGLDPRM